MKFYFRSCQKPRKGRPGHSHVVTSYQERSRCQNKLRGPRCGDLIHFIFLYSATAKLSTNLCETADVTSNLGSDLELLESIECESPTSEVESETELEIEKEAIQNQKVLTQTICLPMKIDLEYYQEVEETERSKKDMENLFDGTEALET